MPAVARVQTPAAPERAGAEQINVAYQPFIEFATGTMVGVEALARFPGRSTAQVLRRAELAGHSEAIDLGVLKCVIAELRGGAAQITPVYVNVSSASIPRPRYLSTVSRWLGDTPDIAQRLVFDVTETAPLPSPTAVRRFAAGIRSLGARIAVDDVPAGYDRVYAISLLQPDVIKLDGDTLHRSLAQASERVRIEAMTIMARDHNAIVIAEGIEAPAHVRAALEFGATIGQGYHLGRPRCCPLSDVRPFQLGDR